MREVVEIWLRLQIGRKNVSVRKKCRESALIKPLSLSIWAAEENLNRVHQASRCCKFGCKKTHVVFEQLELNFKKQKKTSWLVAKMKESYCVQGRTLGGGVGVNPPPWICHVTKTSLLMQRSLCMFSYIFACLMTT